MAASAPSKLILCGEHAVVFGRPAIALPLTGVRAEATVEAGERGSGVVFDAPDLGRSWRLADRPDDPFSELVCALLNRLAPGETLDLRVAMRSDIPVASGMGSGAAIATALVRALAGHLGATLAPEEISALVYESERRFHGTPSGIDNTVVAFERAVWFQRVTDTRSPTGQEPSAVDDRVPVTTGGRRLTTALIEPVCIGAPLTLLIGDTGVRSETKLPVGEVRRRREVEPARYEALFDRVGRAVAEVRAALAAGDVGTLGALLSENHALLREIGVSSPELERLVSAALEGGALGAKLSGAGWGGVMIAVVRPESRDVVREALVRGGAARVLATDVAPTRVTSGVIDCRS
jgi:mevalonate kinase